MTTDELRRYRFSWVDEESLVERLSEKVCEDCPAWVYEKDIGNRYCPHEDPTSLSCIRWYEVQSYLKTMVLADKQLCDVFGERND